MEGSRAEIGEEEERSKEVSGVAKIRRRTEADWMMLATMNEFLKPILD